MERIITRFWNRSLGLTTWGRICSHLTIDTSERNGGSEYTSQTELTLKAIRLHDSQLEDPPPSEKRKNKKEGLAAEHGLMTRFSFRLRCH